jgi:hypothetical protein
MQRTRTALIAGLLAAALPLALVPVALAARHGMADCRRDQLGVRSNGTEGTAGTIHGAWVFTNLSGTACRLEGYPDLQLYGRSGRQIRTIVRRNLPPAPRVVNLAPGASATFFSSYSDVPSTARGCAMSHVMQVTAPNATESLFIPAELGPCRGIVQVSAVTAGIHHA